MSDTKIMLIAFVSVLGIVIIGGLFINQLKSNADGSPCTQIMNGCPPSGMYNPNPNQGCPPNSTYTAYGVMQSGKCNFSNSMPG